MNTLRDYQDAAPRGSSAVARVVADYPHNINEEVTVKGN